MDKFVCWSCLLISGCVSSAVGSVLSRLLFGRSPPCLLVDENSDSLHVGSVRSWVFLIPIVQVPIAYLQILQVPTIVIFTMSPPFPKSRTLK